MKQPNFDIYIVGGYIRDELLGVKSKDIDVACEAPSFGEMLEWIECSHKKVFEINPEYFTVRAMGEDGQAYDYVMCRKEGPYSDGRRPDFVEPGTIHDEQKRRDFTINSIVKNFFTGELLDPFGGQQDLENGLIRCVGKAEDRISEDSLRLLRAIRFAVTKNFWIDESIMDILCDGVYANNTIVTLASVSDDRIRQELLKCFRHDTVKTLWYLEKMALGLKNEVFKTVWLKPTMEDK